MGRKVPLQRLGDVMLGFLLYTGLGLIGFVASVLLLERVICWLVRLAAPILPNDIAGPEGWLVDTDSRGGVFDPMARG